MHRKPVLRCGGCERLARGVTLTELLVVVGILAVLVAILLPVLGRVRQEAMKITCASDLRNWGQAVTLYGSDNQGALPYNGPPQPDRGISAGGADLPGNSTAVRNFINEYLAPMRAETRDLANSVLYCPTEQWNRRQDPDVIYTQTLLGYHIIFGRSGEAEYTSYDPPAWAAKARLDGPYAHTPLMTDQNLRLIDGGEESALFGEFALSNHASRHEGVPHGANFLFEDGHVAWHDQQDIGLAAESQGWNYYYYIDIAGAVPDYE